MLFFVVEATPYNLGEHWRLRLRPVEALVTLPSSIHIARVNKTVPVSECEVVDGRDVALCVDHELPGDAADYVGTVALDVSGHYLVVG
jgi:hypothetical protein